MCITKINVNVIGGGQELPHCLLLVIVNTFATNIYCHDKMSAEINVSFNNINLTVNNQAFLRLKFAKELSEYESSFIKKTKQKKHKIKDKKL